MTVRWHIISSPADPFCANTRMDARICGHDVSLHPSESAVLHHAGWMPTSTGMTVAGACAFSFVVPTEAGILSGRFHIARRMDARVHGHDGGRGPAWGVFIRRSRGSGKPSALFTQARRMDAHVHGHDGGEA